jgi:hypothetical protein
MLTDLFCFLLTPREYAQLRRCSERTIERERASGTGCQYIKIGRSVRYMQADVIDFIERHARQSTSEPTALIVPAPVERAERIRNRKGRARGSTTASTTLVYTLPHEKDG